MLLMTAGVQHLTAKLHIAADGDGVRRASMWLEEAGAGLAVPDFERGRLDLCLHEALANIISHGSPLAMGAPIHVCLDVRRDGDTHEATVTVSDAGPAFDMAHAPLRPRPQVLADAEPGGLGLLMIRSFSDHQHYSYSDGRNNLGFSVRWVDAR